LSATGHEPNQGAQRQPRRCSCREPHLPVPNWGRLGTDRPERPCHSASRSRSPAKLRDGDKGKDDNHEEAKGHQNLTEEAAVQDGCKG
jgi:hypothetical protein